MTDIPGSALETNKANEKHHNTSGDWTSSLNIGEMWREHPVGTGITAAAVAAATAYAAYRFGPAALRALPEMGTAMTYGATGTAAAAGLYGAGKLLFADGANTFSGNGWTEHGANLLRSASDLSVAGGATAAGIGVLTHNPGLAMKGLGAIAAGATTHVGLDYFAPHSDHRNDTRAAFGHTADTRTAFGHTPDPELPTSSAGKPKGGYNASDLDRNQRTAAFGHTLDSSADLPAHGFGKLKGGYNASDLDRDQRMPPKIICDQSGCYDMRAIAGGKIGLDQFMNGKKPVGIYKLVNDNDESCMQGSRKLPDRMSIGAESIDSRDLRAILEKNSKLDISRMLLDDQNKHRRYIQHIG